MRVAISPRSFRQVPGRHQEILLASGHVPQFPSVDRPLTEDEMVDLVDGCHALIVGIDPVTARVLESAPIRVVAKYGSGLDNIDLNAAKERGIDVVPTPGRNSQAVAELTVAFLFALSRHVVPHHASAAAGTWRRQIGMELAGKHLGLIGLGQIGTRVARMAVGIGMEVLGHDPFVTDAGIETATLDELLTRSDAVSLHTPLTAETREMVDMEFVASMRPGALFVNTARFGLVNIDAVADGLASGHLAGAAFDDFEDRPDPGARLWSLPGFLASPHAGASTVEAVERTGMAAVQIVIAALGLVNSE